ncbi:hypothetical protein [Chryseobacterium populi]|nr:hypothetical protein [Chryseobacterium populi]
MKKSLIIVSVALISNLMFAQVGINTPDPQASLDIQSKGNTASTKAMRINNSDNTEMITITDAGRVGIGIVIPDSPLHIATSDPNGIISERASTSAVGSPSYLILRRNNAATPTVNGAVSSGNGLGAIVFSGNTGNGYEGSLITAYTSIVGYATENYSTGTQGSELRFYTVPNGTATNAERMTIKNDGNLGVGTNTPTTKLDVAGTARIRTMDIAAGPIIVTPVYADTNGVLNKAVSNVYGAVINNMVTVASGGTGTLITGIAEGGGYKAVVYVTNACGRIAVAEYYVTNVNFNNAFSIKGIDGLLNTDTTIKGPTFTEVNRNTTSVVWSGVPNCAGGTSTVFSYTLTMPSMGIINVTNDGNISLDYRIILTRIF